MKKAAYISNTFLVSLSLLGILFKIMHWPGAGIVIITGISGCALIGLSIAAIYTYQKT